MRRQACPQGHDEVVGVVLHRHVLRHGSGRYGAAHNSGKRAAPFRTERGRDASTGCLEKPPDDRSTTAHRARARKFSLWVLLPGVLGQVLRNGSKHIRRSAKSEICDRV